MTDLGLQVGKMFVFCHDCAHAGALDTPNARMFLSIQPPAGTTTPLGNVIVV